MKPKNIINSVQNKKGLLNNNKTKSDEIYWHKKIKTPIGAVDLVAHDQALLVVQTPNDPHDQLRFFKLKKGADHPLLKRAEQQLNEYFQGTRQVFDLPLEFRGTEFQKKVWGALLKIPYGQCITYGAQAAQIGRPQAARAVGASNSRNPLAIIVPCHRVIGASGALVGYAGGLSMKQKLLQIEGVTF